MTAIPPPKVLFMRLKKEFSEYLPEDCDHLLNECTRSVGGRPAFTTHRTIGVNLCQNYNLPPDDLRWKWETVKHLSRETHRLDASSLDELQRYIIQEQAKPTRPATKGSGVRLSGVMSMRGGTSGYGLGRIPRQLDGGFMSGVKKEDVDRPVPVAGSSKISFSQVGGIERRERECLIGVDFPCANPVRLLDRYMYEKLSERSDSTCSSRLKKSYH